MSGKCKLQLSRSLEDKLNCIIECPEESSLDVSSLDILYILGFSYTNVTNYVGVSTNYQLHNSSLSVTGVVLLKNLPDEQNIKQILEPIQAFHQLSLGDHSKTDKNSHLYLIFYKDEDSKKAIRRMFNVNEGKFLDEQPVISTLDDTKIYMHSAIVKIQTELNLALLEDSGKLKSLEGINLAIEDAKSQLAPSKMHFHVEKSNFSTKNPGDNKSIVETIYATLDIPYEVEQKGDYLPQMTKDEKKKLHAKWRNKVKDQRAPLEIGLEFENLSDNGNSSEFYSLKVDDYFHLQVNDSISKSAGQMCYFLKQKLEFLKHVLSIQCNGDDRAIENNEIKTCSFRPDGLNFFIQSVYLIPSKQPVQYEKLKSIRRELHEAYLLPLDKPALRYSQRILNVELKNRDQLNGLLCNVHDEIGEKSGIKGATLHQLVSGTYTYHHYMQNRANDNGWGCAYRSLQTIISWFMHQGYIYSPDIELRAPVGAKQDDKTSGLRQKLSLEERVPTHEEIQQVLVDVGDKQASFVGTQKWIGSQEVCFVLNHLFNIESKFISVSSGSELVYKARELAQHFLTQSSPIMIGGGVLAHTIIGVDFNHKNGDIGYLILDPHYTGTEDLSVITKKGWCGWKKNSFWDKTAFYNLCLPQRPIEY